jgi:hypothetical protein
MFSFNEDLMIFVTVWSEPRALETLTFVRAVKGATDISVPGERFSQGLSPGLSGSGVRPFSRARFCQDKSWTEVLLLFSDMLEGSQV